MQAENRDPETPTWRRSSRSSGDTRIEVALVDGQYLVRDGRHPEQQPLAFTPDVFAATLEAPVAEATAAAPAHSAAAAAARAPGEVAAPAGLAGASASHMIAR